MAQISTSSFARLLREAKAKRLITYEELGETTGVPGPTICAMATGRICPPVDTARIKVLATTLKIDEATLLAAATKDRLEYKIKKTSRVLRKLKAVATKETKNAQRI